MLSLTMILESFADAFLTVGVYVAAIFALTGWARVRWGHLFEDVLLRRRRMGPIVAGLMTLPPGCIGVLVVSRLYVRGSTSYGTALTALIATMGDSAWLLLAERPVLTVGLKLAFFVLGVAVGYGVDAVGIAPAALKELTAVGARVAPTTGFGPSYASRGRLASEPGPHHVATVSGGVFPSKRVAVRSLPLRFLLFWVTVAVGLAISLPQTLHFVDEEATGVVGLIVGASGLLASAAVFVGSRCRLGCGEESHDIEGSGTEVLSNGARESAFVTLCLAVIFAISDHLIEAGLIVPGAEYVAGVVGVLVGAIVGLIPACGVEVLISALFVTGALPFPGLVAYLLSQDGNGFIPIAIRDPRAALHGTVVTTIVAVIAGLAVLAVT